MLPMTDDPVRSRITTPAGPRTFQEYLVRDGAADEITGIAPGGDRDGPPRPRPAGGDRRGRADRDRPLQPRRLDRDDPGGAGGARRAARPPGGHAWRSAPSSAAPPSRAPPTGSCAGAGYPECSATQMARIYADVAAAFVLDDADAGEAPAIAALGVRPVLTDALMPDRAARARLAADGPGGGSRERRHLGGDAGEAAAGGAAAAHLRPRRPRPAGAAGGDAHRRPRRLRRGAASSPG